jgi:hypothetical protein
MEQMLIKQLADCIWDIERYVRHKSLSIECKYRELRELQARRAKTLAQRKDAQKNKLAVPEPATALGRMSELEITIDDSVENVDAILEKPAAELDHARALEASIVYHLQLDHAYCTAIARRDDTLEQIERYHRSNRRSNLGASATKHIVRLFPRKPALSAGVSLRIPIIFALRNLVRSVAK